MKERGGKATKESKHQNERNNKNAFKQRGFQI